MVYYIDHSTDCNYITAGANMINHDQIQDLIDTNSDYHKQYFVWQMDPDNTDIKQFFIEYIEPDIISNSDRGEILSSPDNGYEYDTEVNGTTYYLYRQ